MQIPSILQGESRTRLIQGMVIGAVASMVIGFSWGGWVLGSTAHRLAADQASTAVVAVVTPLCVTKFPQDGDAKASLAVLQKISNNWEQGQYLERVAGRHGQGPPLPTTSWPGRVQLNLSLRLNELGNAMSLDLFMNDTCPRCRKPIKLAVIQQHPTRRDLSVQKFECAACGDVQTKMLLRKQAVAV